MTAPRFSPIAVGCHVFAGGFTVGVLRAMRVLEQLEIHDLGRATVESMGVEVIRRDSWTEWPERRGDFLFGNPRCTGFSCMTAGYDDSAHGPWAKQTRDVHDLCAYGVKYGFPVICWESVQQAYTVGRPLLDYLRDDVFAPAGYRIAHLFLNAATWGNAQHRKRYFFVAYKNGLRFNVAAPDIAERHATVGDFILTPEMREHARRAHPCKFKNAHAQYDAESYRIMGDEVRSLIPHMPKNCGLNGIGHKFPELLQRYAPSLWLKWCDRESAMPFSMHDAYRLHENCYMPVIAGSCSRYVHPTENRPCTVRELAALMGWPAELLPRGPLPHAQLGKGIVPAVGEWLAEQVGLCLLGTWGDEDWESSYDDSRGAWVGRDFTGDEIKPPEKVFNMNKYCPEKPEKCTASRDSSAATV